MSVTWNHPWDNFFMLHIMAFSNYAIWLQLPDFNLFFSFFLTMFIPVKLEFYWSGANFHKSCSILVVVSKLLDWLYGIETQWNHKLYSMNWVVLDQVWVFELSCCGYGFQVTVLLLLQAIDEAAFSVAYANMCRCLVPVSKKKCMMTHWKSVFAHISYFIVISHCNFYLNMSSQECCFCCFTNSHMEPWAAALRTVLLFSCFHCRKKWWWRRRE